MTQVRRDRRSPAAAVGAVAPRSAMGAVAALAAGCMTSKVDETRQVASPIEANESIVLLKKPQLEGVGTEEVFLDCVQERLGGELVHPEEGQSAQSRNDRAHAVQDLRRAGIHGCAVPVVRAEHGASQHRRAARAAAAAGRHRAAAGDRRALRGLGRRQHAQDRTAAAASPARSGRAAAAASASAGGKRNRATSPRSGTCATPPRSARSAPTSRHVGADRRRSRRSRSSRPCARRPATDSATSCVRSCVGDDLAPPGARRLPRARPRRASGSR